MPQALSFLVVEDEESVRRLLVRALASHGHVEAVGTCAAARLALRGRRYDGIVVDVRLPDGSGLDLLELAKKRCPGICILVLTGSTDHAVISHVLEAGARYMLKPADAKHLRLLAEEALSRRTARERRTTVTLERWAKDYGLSETEVELLSLGAQGVAREKFSSRRGVRPDTIRKQIQTLLQKTGDDTFEGAVNSLLREAVAEPT
jgi:DNA-binding NarL/FixJ family response regulator